MRLRTRAIHRLVSLILLPTAAVSSPATSAWRAPLMCPAPSIRADGWWLKALPGRRGPLAVDFQPFVSRHEVTLADYGVRWSFFTDHART